jgi:site-specific DNA-methyltransferase (adenine-specific)
MKPFYDHEGITIYHGDCRDFVAPLEAVTIADPPYEQTSLTWDRWPDGWIARLTGASLWCFGSLRMFMDRAQEFAGWTLSQDLVWEKQNGSNSSGDRFRRVHEQPAHFYRGRWEDVYKAVVTTPDAVQKSLRRKGRPPHWGHIGGAAYESHDGGPRQMRSVIYTPNCHGYAVHPTQKPIAILQPLIEYACPPGGTLYVPFAGSGSELVAARLLGRRAIGIEANEQWCDVAACRLSSDLPLSFDAVGEPTNDAAGEHTRGKDLFF